MNQKVIRGLFYLLGLTIMAIGIILNTKSSFGVSPIISSAYCVSVILHLNFGNVSLALYVILAAAEYIIKGRNFRIYDLLQIPLSFLLTRLFNLFGALLPDVVSIPVRILCLICGIALTGIGAAMNLNARLVPNPGDGIVQAIADRWNKRLGNVKNIFDISCTILTCAISLAAEGHLVGVGIGTAAAMIGVGRFIWLYNRFFRAKQLKASGMQFSA